MLRHREDLFEITKNSIFYFDNLVINVNIMTSLIRQQSSFKFAKNLLSFKILYNSIVQNDRHLNNDSSHYLIYFTKLTKQSLFKIKSNINEEDNFDLNVRCNIFANRINHLYIEYELVRFKSKAVSLRLNALKKTMKTLITKKKLQAEVAMLQNNINNDFANIINRLNQMSANKSTNTALLSSLVYAQQNDHSYRTLEALLKENETHSQNYRDRFMQRS